MVGSEGQALAALRGELQEFAAGHERRVYLSDRVVYKVEIDQSGANREDWAMYQALSHRRLPDGIRIPDMSSYRFGTETVIASAYVEGDPARACPLDLARLQGDELIASQDEVPVQCPQDGACITTELAATLFDELNVTDIGQDNLIRSSDGTLWIVDLF